MRIVKDGWALIVGCPVVLAALGVGCGVMGWGRPATAFYVAAALSCAFMFYFFRDPDRRAPEDPLVIVAGADGLIRAVETFREEQHLKTDAVRISIFLSPFDVHVNRAPLGGRVAELNYTPGRHLLTIQNAASEYNEHSVIVIEGERTRCLVKQIVGPIVRRVVYWLETNQTLQKGERIGMMKFGSRLDMYFPANDVQVVVKKGDRVRAGLTVVAKIVK